MSTESEPEIVLYDLASERHVCFSPAVWRIRLMLNYKKVPYKTIFLEFPDIEPTLKGLGLSPAESTSALKLKYTVPAIYYVPTNTYMMDSAPIAQFLESTYPNPPVQLTSELGREIEAKGRAAAGVVFRACLTVPEMNILSPRAALYFRRSREAAAGHRLEDLTDPQKQEQAWKAADDGIRANGELMRTHKADGPFVLGSQPSYTDFFITGNLQVARVVDEKVFERFLQYPGYRDIYEACLPYMEKKD